ncbi:MAG: non-heme iron oxygenase ferredoxin subunit [Pirellula sp.]
MNPTTFKTQIQSQALRSIGFASRLPLSQKEDIINQRDFQYVCELGDLKPGKPSTFEVEDRFVVVVHLDGQIYCIEDLCTHDGGTLGDGELEGNCLVCPRHGAKFDVRNGHVTCMPATENTPSHEVKIDGSRILVRLND